MENDMGIGEEIRKIQEYLNQLQPGNTSISFTELMEVLLQGNMKEALNTAGKMLQSALFSQAKEGQVLLVQVALLGLTGAVFSHAASAFKGSQIPETAFYVIYLLIFTCLAGSFLSSIQITAQVLDQILEFVRLLMPAYFISVAFAGGSASAAAFYEIALGAAWAVQWLCRRGFLSFVRVYGLLVLGDHMMEEPCFSKLTDLIGKMVCRQRREVSCYEICGNGAGAWAGNRGSSPACIWKQCIDQKQYGSSSGHYPCSDHTGACGEAGSSYGHVSGGGGSFTAGM